MNSVVRAVVSAIAGVATFYFVLWVPFSLILPHGRLGWVSALGSMVCAFAVARYVWRHSAAVSQGLVRSVVFGAVVIGGVGFSAGFFGPIVFAPEANKGPLLGIFVTGPLGVLAGAVGGGIYWFVRRSRT